MKESEGIYVPSSTLNALRHPGHLYGTGRYDTEPHRRCGVFPQRLGRMPFVTHRCLWLVTEPLFLL